LTGSSIGSRVSLSSDNGSTYGTEVSFTNGGLTQAGYFQFFLTDNGSSGKPWYQLDGASNPSIQTYTTTTGVVNAIKISANSGIYTGTGTIYIYGMN
jgi:hypothetical protein